ncbi:PREDICTED: LRRN4 C-terminal-like protein [Nanorana parkeri]|uniref:LRRN4 C-terminal-like protein n=1 Tax=Nanorana parkeri TaxID=125878 RepID=UPI000854E5A3|nr:PREDICTED: LRRN4 C-terminal-like protein [Nanorana parkeri]
MVSFVLPLLLHICLINTRSLVLAVEDLASLQASTAAPATASNQSTAIQHTKVTNQKRLLYISEPEEDYYDDDEEETPVPPPPPVPKNPCTYDRCEHLSPTCEDIQNKAGGNCLCPGIDGPNIKPDPPQLSQVLPGDREVTVNWCSPSSTVRSYKVLYLGPNSQVEEGPALNASYRSYSIANLLPATQYTVCVVAINDAGESPAEINEAEEDTEGSMRGPCRMLHTTASKTSHMYIGIGVGLGALVVVMAVLGILLCIKKKKKNRMDVEEKEMGIPNHSYKVGSIY